MSKFTVVYDPCVLYPAPLRDLLMRLALTDLFHARWSNAIHDEWMEKVLENRPYLTREQLERTRRLMDLHVRDGKVEGYEYLIESLHLPDPGDRHVLAAAIHSKSDAIVTSNLKDFPDEVLAKYGLEAIHPDDFIVYQIGLSPQMVCVAVKEHRASLKNPPKSVDEYLDTLLQQSLPQTVSYLRGCKGLI